MSGFFFDANVLLDIATADATWLAWSEGQFQVAAAQGPIPTSRVAACRAATFQPKAERSGE